jgi:hypothetical protein
LQIRFDKHNGNIFEIFAIFFFGIPYWYALENAWPKKNALETLNVIA